MSFFVGKDNKFSPFFSSKGSNVFSRVNKLSVLKNVLTICSYWYKPKAIQTGITRGSYSRNIVGILSAQRYDFVETTAFNLGDVILHKGDLQDNHSGSYSRLLRVSRSVCTPL